MTNKYVKGIKLANTTIIAGVASILILQTSVFAADNDEAVLVNVDNFVRAETAAQFDRVLQIPGAAINTLK
jgi:hypothetical protein